MKRIIETSLLVSLAAIAFSVEHLSTQPSLAQIAPDQATDDRTPDPRIQEALDALNLNYEIEDDGSYKVGLQFEGDRTQVAWINSSTTTLGSMEIREIVSPAYLTSGSLSSDIANQLLRDSAQKKLGAWQTYQNDEQAIAVFTARVDANSSVDDLEAALYAVLYSADQMEEELTGGDRF